MNAGLSIQLHACSHVGLGRENNEDSLGWNGWIVNDRQEVEGKALLAPAANEPVVAVVADGMGGHQAGEVASRVVVESLCGPGWFTDSCAEPEHVVQDRLAHVHSRIDQMALEDLSRFGMGSTVAGILVLNGQLTWFNIGDSRIYLQDDAGFQQLSIDDRSGGKRSNILTQALGGNRAPVAHTGVHTLQMGNKILLCSDGLSDPLDERLINKMLAEGDPVTSIVDRALAAGGRDNISALLVNVL